MSRKKKKSGRLLRATRKPMAVGVVLLMAVLLLDGVLLPTPEGNAHDEAGLRILAAALPGVATATPVPTPVPTPAPTAVPTPRPTAVPTPSPTAVPTPSPTPVPTPEPPRVRIQYPYAIVVDRGAQIVTVLTVGPSGKYDVIARQMICSTDKYNRKPGNGVYQLDGERKRWLYTLTGSYAQYATRISGTILFHSVPYSRQRSDALMAKEYYKLGKNVSEGCVRLTCEDAKWIYENIPDGTLVRFTSGTYNADALWVLAPPALSGGKWDPTDGSKGNPDYIGSSYHRVPVATPWPYATPIPTHYPLSVWKRPS